jgi:hypothetical protein
MMHRELAGTILNAFYDLRDDVRQVAHVSGEVAASEFPTEDPAGVAIDAGGIHRISGEGLITGPSIPPTDVGGSVQRSSRALSG